ncbi:MAG: hypothetical protein JSS49_17440 [Planctomycetes bacterium]|nr:hypothetical protein [Planctomycetota bacterium]
MLAIQWDKKRLRVIEASIGASVRVVQSFMVDVPELPKSTWLRDALRHHGTTARQVLVCLPREDAILRQLELPDAPDDELPSLVYFQASTRSTTPLDQLLVDYLPLPRRPGTVQRDVLLATVPRTTVDPIRAALTDAGLDLISLTLTSFSLAELVLRAEVMHGPGTRSRLVVLADSSRLEVVLLGRHEPLVAHLARPPVDDAGHPIIAKAAADISRILVPAQPWLADSPIERIWLLEEGTEWVGLDNALHERWNCPVERFNLQLAGKIRDLELSKFTESIISFAPALGLALGRLQPRSPVLDLLHPRQPRPKQDPRKVQIAASAAAVLLVATISAAYFQLSMKRLETSIEEATRKASELSSELTRGEPDRKAANEIQDWKSHDVNQLRQFEQLYELMQGTERIVVSEYTFGPGTGDAIAKLHATGNARERVDSQLLTQRMADANRYRVKPREVIQQNHDSDYPVRFELDTDLIQPGGTRQTQSPSTATKGK